MMPPPEAEDRLARQRWLKSPASAACSTQLTGSTPPELLEVPLDDELLPPASTSPELLDAELLELLEPLPPSTALPELLLDELVVPPVDDVLLPSSGSEPGVSPTHAGVETVAAKTIVKTTNERNAIATWCR